MEGIIAKRVNNLRLPFLIYKKALNTATPQEIEEVFKANSWKNSWVNGIYPYHHYHSNTHEVLGIYSGSCKVQLGGEKGSIFLVEKGDVLIIPAGVSHKNVGSTDDFVCVGAYPLDIEYDMHDGAQDPSHMIQNIEKVPLPESDPVYGAGGPLFTYWKMASMTP